MVLVVSSFCLVCFWFWSLLDSPIVMSYEFRVVGREQKPKVPVAKLFVVGNRLALITTVFIGSTKNNQERTKKLTKNNDQIQHRQNTKNKSIDRVWRGGD